jgi:hypothetical protein
VLIDAPGLMNMSSAVLSLQSMHSAMRDRPAPRGGQPEA